MRLIRLTDSGWAAPADPTPRSGLPRGEADRWWHARAAQARLMARAACGEGEDAMSRQAQHWLEWEALAGGK